jgi:DNA-directed RNA polymerase specialized sigma24 family protein
VIDSSQFLAGWDRLTGKQQRLLKLRCLGMEHQDIAAELGLEPKDAKATLKYAFGKLQRARVGAYGRSQSAGVCYMLGYATAQANLRKAA